MHWPRAILIISIGLGLGYAVIRDTHVSLAASGRSATESAIWPTDPSLELSRGLTVIGQAAQAGQPPDPNLLTQLRELSKKDPLAPEPFLVRGVQAMVAGDDDAARDAFLAARRRDPRLIASRYFLAEHYVRTGNGSRALAEIAALANLVPASIPQFVPHLAAYARAPGLAPQVKTMLGKNPEIEPLLLETLAADAENSRLALYLWTGRKGDTARQWQTRLLESLVQAERFAEARSAWARFEGRSAVSPDPDFSLGKLPPFGWSLTSNSSGIAERQDEGQLHIIYYGREDQAMAKQLMTLKPGSHRLQFRVAHASPAARSLALKIRCLPANRELVDLPLSSGANGNVRSTSFEVPQSGCGAQWLEVAGTAPEFPEQAEARISDLRVVAESAQ